VAEHANNRKGKSTQNSKQEQQKGITRGSEPPICLLPEHAEKGVRHKMRNCNKATVEEKKSLLNAYFEKKKGKGAKKLRDHDEKGEERTAETISTLVRATFGNCTTRVLCTDIGSDINCMPPDLFHELQSKNSNMNITVLAPPRHFTLAATVDSKDQPIYMYNSESVVVCCYKTDVRTSPGPPNTGRTRIGHKGDASRSM